MLVNLPFNIIVMRYGAARLTSQDHSKQRSEWPALLAIGVKIQCQNTFVLLRTASHVLRLMSSNTHSWNTSKDGSVFHPRRKKGRDVDCGKGDVNVVTPGEHQETTLIVPDISLLGRIIDRLQIIQILSYSITMDGGGSVQPLAPQGGKSRNSSHSTSDPAHLLQQLVPVTVRLQNRKLSIIPPHQTLKKFYMFMQVSKIGVKRYYIQMKAIQHP